MVWWFTFEKLMHTMSKHVALDIHDGIAFGLIVPQSGIKLASENQRGLHTSVPEALVRRLSLARHEARMNGILLAAASCDKPSHMSVNGSGTLDI